MSTAQCFGFSYEYNCYSQDNILKSSETSSRLDELFYDIRFECEIMTYSQPDVWKAPMQRLLPDGKKVIIHY